MTPPYALWSCCAWAAYSPRGLPCPALRACRDQPARAVSERGEERPADRSRRASPGVVCGADGV